MIKKKKTLPAMLELDPLWVGPLEEEMASHSSFFAWEIPWTEKLGGYSPWCLKESDLTEYIHTCKLLYNTKSI